MCVVVCEWLCSVVCWRVCRARGVVVLCVLFDCLLGVDCVLSVCCLRLVFDGLLCVVVCVVMCCCLLVCCVCVCG